MSAPVFLAAAAELAGARPHATVTVRGDEARHAVSVRRIRAGEVVELVDGAGTRVRGTVAHAAPDALSVAVDDVTHEPAPDVALVLVQALAKGGRDEQAVETATEAGVDAVVPWQSERCISVWAGAKAARGRERWAAVARAAAKQSRRAWVPPVRDLVVGRALVAATQATVAAGGAVLVLHEEATTPLAAATLPAGPPSAPPAGPATPSSPAGPPTPPVAPPATPEVLVVVGPEGGLTDGEVEALVGAGGQAVRLGPHVVRTSTAGPLAVASLAQRLGRWG
ncbi:16S rRNA (uracil(1498)-N(3))-methyltransferase [Georgenia faecalis]|uniref:Ribosomal RNA small subunit methyltransferase E n=1 Tax=Georgenia faecalis TaxID=2483799 RepID=A0ABV9D9Y8_9MICO|nr:16S rRNA (uracil(1498)-N(3))-methyltransferase [Georgenia faecalis]